MKVIRTLGGIVRAPVTLEEWILSRPDGDELRVITIPLRGVTLFSQRTKQRFDVSLKCWCGAPAVVSRVDQPVVCLEHQ